MKIAKRYILENELKPYTRTISNHVYIAESDVKEITAFLLLNYNNIYCQTKNNDSGEVRFFIHSSITHNVLFDIEILRDE